MAQGPRNNNRGASGASSGPRPPRAKPKGPAGTKTPTGKGKATGRQSVAAARRNSGGSNRVQLIVGISAVVIIAAIIVVGLIMNKANNGVQGDGYGVSKTSTATVDGGGIVTVTNGSPKLTLDVYEDALCPICGAFEAQFGQQIAKAIDDGQLTVKYHTVDFLNASSASKDYSTRAFAALLAVAKVDGAKPGVFMQFHTALFNSANQPKENGTSDLSNTQLAELAGKSGVSAEAQKEIESGSGVAAASTDAATNSASLTAVAKASGVGPGTPTVAKDGKIVNINSAGWLTGLLAAG